MHSQIVRNMAWLSFFVLILFSWWFIYDMAMDMDLDLIGRPGPAGEVMRQMDPRMDMYMPMASFWPLFLMWVVMMAAMMLPTMIPTLRVYSDLIDNANGTLAGWLGVLSGYSIVWVLISAVFVAVQLLLLYSGFVDMLGIARSPYFAGALLILVGAYQFTHYKEACQNVCLTPMNYFLANWQTGFGGGLRMGVGLGLFCVGCCWGLMALGFVGGVMSLLWMGLATALMVLEKLQPVGRWVTRPVGALLIIGGVVVMTAPVWQGG